MNKYIIICVVAVLAAAVAIFAILNAGDIDEKMQSQQNATVTLISGDNTETFDLDDLMSLEKTVFEANVKESGKDAIRQDFGGVPLASLLEAKGFSLENASEVIFRAADGYTTVATANEVAEKDNIYVVYERSGKPSGARAEGGTGPVEIVIAKDQFSQRWCKYLMEIEIR